MTQFSSLEERRAAEGWSAEAEMQQSAPINYEERKALDTLVMAYGIEAAIDSGYVPIADSLGIKHESASQAKSRVDRHLEKLRDTVKAYMRDAAGNIRIPELLDPESGVRAELKAVGGARYLDFEALHPVQIVELARAGLLSLNVTAFDGAKASSDLRLSGLAAQVEPHVHNGQKAPSLYLSKGSGQ